MPKLIQSQARGLLSLLTSKDGGLGPPAMEDNLRAVLETRDFYGLNGRGGINFGQTVANLDAATGWIAGGGAGVIGWRPCFGTAGNNDLRVPQGELWRVLSVQFRATRVNGSVVLAAGWAHGESPTWYFGAVGPTAAAVLAAQSQTAGGPCDFIAMPGSAPAFHFNQWLVGTFDFDLEVFVLYERVPL